MTMNTLPSVKLQLEFHFREQSIITIKLSLMTEKHINTSAKSTDACLNCKQNIKIDGCALSRTEKPSSKKENSA